MHPIVPNICKDVSTNCVKLTRNCFKHKLSTHELQTAYALLYRIFILTDLHTTSFLSINLKWFSFRTNDATYRRRRRIAQLMIWIPSQEVTSVWIFIANSKLISCSVTTPSQILIYDTQQSTTQMKHTLKLFTTPIATTIWISALLHRFIAVST